ncbi:MAG: hypothetical protein OXR66_00460 [Candidatus Woesearchaeota archaeon]|nr:hypothetical protein [Candidatus Woesearchaeota archaeon]
MNKKGTEKPIEIFVALFIILAVALVMLKLFQSQIADKQKELADVQQETKAKELREKVELACAEKCTQASNNGCNRASLASLCMYGSHRVLKDNEFIDLNNNNKPDYDDSLLAGIGVCEDRLYCFHMMGSCCAREISAAECRLILKDYWTEVEILKPTGTPPTITPGDVTTQLNALVPSGSCPAPAGAPTGMRWDEQDSWTT